jgi:hypothetical protein
MGRRGMRARGFGSGCFDGSRHGALLPLFNPPAREDGALYADLPAAQEALGEGRVTA